MTSDKKIIAGYLSGSTAAYKHVDTIVNSVYYRWQNRFGYEKDDIISDIHLKLLNSFRQDNFELKKELIAFITIIVNRTCIDHLRLRVRFNTVDVSELPIPDKEPIGDKQLEIKELAKLNFRAIQMAPKECRRLWRLHLLKGMKYREIAKIDERTPAFIKRKFWECREKVKEIRKKMIKE